MAKKNESTPDGIICQRCKDAGIHKVTADVYPRKAKVSAEGSLSGENALESGVFE